MRYILTNWEKSDPESLKEKRLIFFCNMAWPQYKLGDRKVRPIHGNINFNTILQLDLFCHSQRNWTEAAHNQVFMALSNDPPLCTTCKLDPPVIAILYSQLPYLPRKRLLLLLASPGPGGRRVNHQSGSSSPSPVPGTSRTCFNLPFTRSIDTNRNPY